MPSLWQADFPVIILVLGVVIEKRFYLMSKICTEYFTGCDLFN